MPMNEFMAYGILLSSFVLMLKRHDASSVFVFSYLIMWEVMKLGLISVGYYYESLMPILFGVLIDLYYIVEIKERNMESGIVGPAIVLSSMFGAMYMVEEVTDGYILSSVYHWVNVALAGIILAGGIFSEPRGGRGFDGGGRFSRILLRCYRMGMSFPPKKV